MPKRKDSLEPNADLPTKRLPDSPSSEFHFCGEDESPVFGDKRHAGLDTTYLEVSPENLIEVAKHLAGQGIAHVEAVARAYGIICEAHLVSGNIRRWNEKVRRHHSTELVSGLVAQAPKNEHGEPRRLPLLVTLFQELGLGSNATNVSNRFNEWFRNSARLADYRATVPWDAARPGFDPQLHHRMVKTGWIKWFFIGGAGHFVLPENTAPAGKPPRAPIANEHQTRPYWDTDDLWWPEPAKEEIERLKSECLNNKRDAFRSAHHARQALEKFVRWLEEEQAMRGSTKPPKRPRSSSGEFVSPRDKGAGRGRKGQFRKKTQE